MPRAKSVTMRRMSKVFRERIVFPVAESLLHHPPETLGQSVFLELLPGCRRSLQIIGIECMQKRPDNREDIGLIGLEQRRHQGAIDGIFRVIGLNEARCSREPLLAGKKFPARRNVVAQTLLHQAKLAQDHGRAVGSKGLGVKPNVEQPVFFGVGNGPFSYEQERLPRILKLDFGLERKHRNLVDTPKFRRHQDQAPAASPRTRRPRRAKGRCAIRWQRDGRDLI